MKNRRIIYVLIGPPAIGKSTWIKKYTDSDNTFVINSDDITERVAESLGWTYDDLFVFPPSDAKIGEVDEKYGEVVAAPDFMSWRKTTFEKVNYGREKINQEFDSAIDYAKNTDKNIVVDLTNMNLKFRKNALDRVSQPGDYKIAVIFNFVGKEKLIKAVSEKRAEVAKRMGKTKTIPIEVLEKMMANYDPPSPSEGYDKIIYSNSIPALKKSIGLKEVRQIIKREVNNLFENTKEVQTEAYIHSWIPNEVFKMLGIDEKSVTKLGEGDNGIAFKYNDKTIKVTSDAEEAEFSAAIKGHKLSTVANVYEVYEYDTESGEDNRRTSQFYRSRFYWIIVKDYVPHRFGSDYSYGDALRYFDSYQEKNFDYSEEAFNRMINEYRNDTIEGMSDHENYDVEEDYELEQTLDWFEFFKQLHLELKPLGILSVCDMKGSNMGYNDDGEPIYIELHIYKYANGYKEQSYKKLEPQEIMAESENLEQYKDFPKEEYLQQLKRLNINRFEELIGRTVYNVKPSYGEHKVLKWIPETMEYLLFTDGYKVLASPFVISIVPHNVEKEDNSELKWVIAKFCEKNEKDIKSINIKSINIDDNLNLIVKFNIVYSDYDFIQAQREIINVEVLFEDVVLKMFVENNKIPKMVLNNKGKQKILKSSDGNLNGVWNELPPFTQENPNTIDIDKNKMAKIIEKTILEKI